LRWQRPDTGQLAVLLGFAFLLFAALWDMLYHRDIYLLPALRFAISEMAMAVFVLYSMTALFLATMREVKRARESEARIAAEKEMLPEMNRMKNQFYTVMS
ncbi:histidine kinase, partial [Hungatella sp. SL.1.14]|nr:histidine kinase [Hungatella sp. SL.1.14]